MVLRFCVLMVVLCTFFNGYAEESWIDNVIEDLIREKINDPKVRFELQYESKEKLNKIKDNQSEVSNVVLLSFEPNYSNFKVMVTYNNGLSDEICGIYNSFIEAPVTARVIRSGEIIGKDDIKTSRVKINRAHENFLFELNDIVGMQAKRLLSSGVLFKSSDLIRHIVIKIHDPVSIIYSSGNIRLKTAGVAMGAGAIGDVIKVKNEDTGNILLGQIVSKSTIQVGPE